MHTVTSAFVARHFCGALIITSPVVQKPSKNFFGLTLWRAGKPLLLWWRCGAQHDKGIRNCFVCQSQWRTQKISKGCQSIGIARGGPKGPCPPKVLENRVILCFERRFSKQNSVIRLKLNILLYTAEFWQYTLLNTVYTFFYFFEGLRGTMTQWLPLHTLVAKAYDPHQWWNLETRSRDTSQDQLFRVSVSKVSGLASVSKDFGLGLELLVSRLCMSYFFLKSCKKQLLKKRIYKVIFQNLSAQSGQWLSFLSCYAAMEKTICPLPCL